LRPPNEEGSMVTPTLETARLTLRPRTLADAEEAFANWTGDPEVARYRGWLRSLL